MTAAATIISSILNVVSSNFVIPTIEWGISKLKEFLFGSKQKGVDKATRKEVQRIIRTLEDHTSEEADWIRDQLAPYTN